VSAASLGLGAEQVLVLLLRAAELNRMAELRAQMERLVLDAKAAEARGGDSRSVDDGDSVVKERIVFPDVGDEDVFLSAIPPLRYWRRQIPQTRRRPPPPPPPPKPRRVEFSRSHPPAPLDWRGVWIDPSVRPPARPRGILLFLVTNT
jgi:hypothetical protein